ncbi:MAG: hypothetical protein WA432_01545 [Candidatus Babeliaceae bacterium]
MQHLKQVFLASIIFCTVTQNTFCNLPQSSASKQFNNKADCINAVNQTPLRRLAVTSAVASHLGAFGGILIGFIIGYPFKGFVIGSVAGGIIGIACGEKALALIESYLRQKAQQLEKEAKKYQC